MVNPGKRMNLLKALLSIRHGPGAAILPPEISRIHLDFAMKWNDGHLGPRKFWRECLPRLKFWNPAIPMIVNRSKNQAGPATMSIYFKNPSSTSPSTTTTTSTTTKPSAFSHIAALQNTLPLAQQPQSSVENEFPAPEPAADETVVRIDMKHVKSTAILDEFLAKTGANPVKPSKEDEAEMLQVEDRLDRAALDRAIVRQWLDKKREDERVRNLAKAEADAIKAANA
ncbi:CI-B8 domain-containing protein [Xylariaceae sp. FL0594]|nr:CI-B8 domain-containing protein [Xylariaceae sp. FL0594]